MCSGSPTVENVIIVIPWVNAMNCWNLLKNEFTKENIISHCQNSSRLTYLLLEKNGYG